MKSCTGEQWGCVHGFSRHVCILAVATKHKERFIWLAKIKHKPAFSSYMARQCAYQQKHYPKAIKFYKQSVAIKNQAKYTPTLLWNMAQAYKALKDGKNYKNTLHQLTQYPESQ